MISALVEPHHLIEGFGAGDHVVYGSHGVGKITRTATDAAMGACIVLEFVSGMVVFIPVDRAKAVLRPLSSTTEANEVLAALRLAGVERDARSYKERSEERVRVIRDGSRIEIAGLLRRLYAGKFPASETDDQAIKRLEELLFPELQLVLHIPRAELETEMREAHPVFTKVKLKR